MSDRVPVDCMPGHHARRFQQIALAAFSIKVESTRWDITPVQFAALSALCEHPGVDQATLAGKIAYDRTTIGGVVDRLVKKGLVTREVCRTDRRARTLKITDLGCTALDEIYPAVLEAQELMLVGLDDTEAAQLMALLRKAVTAANHTSRSPKQD